MSQDPKLTNERLSELWDSTDLMRVKVLDTRDKKYVIISDMHLGDGGGGDDFRENEDTLPPALGYYKDSNYELILLGDIEEFWQFDLNKIKKRYEQKVYKQIRAFGDNRVHRVFGNHDAEWGGFVDPTKNTTHQNSDYAPEAIRMKDKNGEARILLVHGFQGSTESDKYSWFSRFWVRVYKFIEPIVKLDRHSSATKSQVTEEYERVIYSWAKERKVIIICGHSHRAIFAAKSYAERLQDEIAAASLLPDEEKNKKIRWLERELRKERERNRDIEPMDKDQEPLPCYFNCGCALYTDGITVLEIEADKIRLVKWNKEGRREVFPDCEGKISLYINQIQSIES